MTTTVLEALERVKRGDHEVIVDFTSVPRIDAGMVEALEELAALTADRPAMVLLRAVTADAYRVLKQLKLAERFSFGN